MRLDTFAIAKNKFQNVQFGRQVEVEIFKTNNNRGWGLRCKQDLYTGMIQTQRIECTVRSQT